MKAKNLGGLGFKEFASLNNALLAKQGWRIIHNLNDLCVKILKGKKWGARASWAWLRLLEGRELLTKGLYRIVGNGVILYVGDDPWVPLLKVFKVKLRPLHSSCLNLIVNELVVNSIWDVQKLDAWFSKLEVEAIRLIPISSSARSDSLVWTPCKDEVYTVKLGYHLVKSLTSVEKIPAQGSSYYPPRELWKVIWNLDTPLKV